MMDAPAPAPPGDPPPLPPTQRPGLGAYTDPATAASWTALAGVLGDAANTYHQLEAFNTQRALAAGGVEVAGRSVLDVGCGEGRMARAMWARGAAAVAGCDASAPLLERARAADPRGAYFLADVRAGAAAPVLPGGPFDVVHSSYLLQISQTEAELDAMLSFCRRQLKPGGKLIALTVSGEYRPPAPDSRMAALMRSHWHWTNVADQQSDRGGGDGSPNRGGAAPGRSLFTMYDGGGRPLATEVDHLFPSAAYVAALQRCGFAAAAVHAWTAPDGLMGDELVRLYVENPDKQCITATAAAVVPDGKGASDA